MGDMATSQSSLSKPKGGDTAPSGLAGAAARASDTGAPRSFITPAFPQAEAMGPGAAFAAGQVNPSLRGNRKKVRKLSEPSPYSYARTLEERSGGQSLLELGQADGFGQNGKAGQPGSGPADDSNRQILEIIRRRQQEAKARAKAVPPTSLLKQPDMAELRTPGGNAPRNLLESAQALAAQRKARDGASPGAQPAGLQPAVFRPGQEAGFGQIGQGGIVRAQAPLTQTQARNPEPQSPTVEKTEPVVPEWNKALPRTIARNRNPDKAAEYLLRQAGLDATQTNLTETAGDQQATQEEYDLMKKEAKAFYNWTPVDAGYYWVEKNVLGREPEERSLKPFKDRWVSGNATTISVIARKYGLPPEMLAGIAWTEVGGDPSIFDTMGATAKHFRLAEGEPDMTSIGDVQIQARHAARLLGHGDKPLTGPEVLRLKSLLERNRALNLGLAAAHINELRRQAFPESMDRPLNKAEIGALAYMYNAGFDERIAQNPEIVETDNFKARSKNGIDLFNKWQDMGQLLETGRR